MVCARVGACACVDANNTHGTGDVKRVNHYGERHRDLVYGVIRAFAKKLGREPDPAVLRGEPVAMPLG